MSLVSPYKDIVQYTKIQLLPHHMNSDIRTNMKLNLKKKVEKKCNNNGFIDEVYRIVDFEDGKLVVENLSGSVNYDIKYECRICIPVENSIIIGQVKIINQELVMLINGPLYIFIPKDNINSNLWNINENFLNKDNNKKLKEGHFVKVRIINKKINQNDYQIKCIGELLDFASENEIEKNFGSIINENNSNEYVEEENNEKNSDDENKSNFII
jgi:DNA-directed RNA polymerase subunit E'/Rpb7